MQRLFITLLSCLLLAACSSEPSSPEQQVRQTLSAMETAAQERSMSNFMRYIADNDSDQEGNNKDALRRSLQILFLRNQNINIFTLVRSIDVKNGLAKVEISTAMASREVDLSQESNRLKADTQRFTLTLSQIHDNELWLVQSATWQQGW